MGKSELKVIELLEHVITTKGGDLPGIGLCTYLSGWLPMNTVYQLFKSWPEYSGNPVFPVPSMCEGISPGQAYMRISVNKYEGVYGDARLRLAQFIIDELKKRIDTNHPTL